MATRPLRQYYDAVTIVDELGDIGGPWRQHRARFSENLASLTAEQWTAPSRCTEWDARGVVSHLVMVDQYWVLALGNAKAGEPPAKFLLGFDPSTSTNPLVGPLLELSNAELLDRFVAGTGVFGALVDSFAPDDWAAIGESPLGHIPARYLFGHAFWDSWLHERDLFLPLGVETPVDPEEVRAITSFALLFAGLQGGLPDDETPVGPGPEQPIDVVLRFDELPDAPLRLQIGSGVSVTSGADSTAVAAGSAVDLVEIFTGRRPLADLSSSLPPDFAAQIARASQVL
jgi:uncharacterized protein (TIGR03083 family)